MTKENNSLISSKKLFIILSKMSINKIKTSSYLTSILLIKNLNKVELIWNNFRKIIILLINSRF